LPQTTAERENKMEYQVTIHKTITLSSIINANSPVEAGLIGRELMINEDETAFIEDTKYSAAEVYELEMENN